MGAVTARMRFALAGDAGDGQRVGVRAGEHPRRARDLANVRLGHRRDQDACLTAVGHDEVTDRVEGIHGAAARHVAKRAARVLGEMRGHGDAHHVP